jgi:hypothetical protein
MNERERWVVYPLLFLALGAALRDKLIDQTISKRIVCQELTIVDDDVTGRHPGRELIKIGRLETAAGPSYGIVQVNGEVLVNGGVRVNGVVDARQIANVGARVLQMLPGMSPAEFARMMQAAEEQRKSAAGKVNQDGKDGEPAQPASKDEPPKK